MAVTVLLSAVAGMLAFQQSAEAQEGVPEFLAREGTPPPGANVPCDPTRKHPYPVVLVHGTFETMDQNWSVVSPRLKEEGYCVFALNYGNRGLDYIGGSARELNRFVNNVLRFTGAKKVQIVGHSQGGMMPRRYIKTENAGNRVEDLVGFAPSNRGTELSEGIPQPPAANLDARSKGASGPCFACDQQAAGSGFLHRLNKGDDTLGSASYTQIATEDDEIIIPFYRCFLKGQKNTRDLILQTFYEKYFAGTDPTVTHQNIYDDPVAQKFMLDALANEGPTNPDRALKDFKLP